MARSTLLLPLLLTLLVSNSVEHCRAGRLGVPPSLGPSQHGKPVIDAGDYWSPKASSCRENVFSIEDFGGVGDGKTSNTQAFRNAMAAISQYSHSGGGLLYVPAGRWLTGSFNLTSHFTLYLDSGAVILGQAAQLAQEYPIIEPLPSYGRGLDIPGPRYSSLIMGFNLTDVIITGNNGTIDGQGSFWWDHFHNETLQYSRPTMIELLYSNNILISNITLVNSPSWNIHPVYSSNVIVSGVTILAPLDSPNTDGINPDSCSQVHIDSCFIQSGDDCVAVKSGWDEYGIKMGIPSRGIVVSNLTCVSPTSAAVAVGSEMSGGIEDVRVVSLTAVNTESSLRVKTARGRGGYIHGVYLRGAKLSTIYRTALWMSGSYKTHADDKFDPSALPSIANISYSDVDADNVTRAAHLEGLSDAPFTGLCLSKVNIEVSAAGAKKMQWNCSDIVGVASDVQPQQCEQLKDLGTGGSCPFPADRLPIEEVDFHQCSFGRM